MKGKKRQQQKNSSTREAKCQNSNRNVQLSILSLNVSLRVSFQVLSVIRSNYDTLTLKLQENLDHYEKYSEKPKEAAFFTQLVSSWMPKKKVRTYKSVTD